MDIRIQDLSMTYPNGKQALSNLNLELKAPSMIGLLGPNGAGKSTLMKLLTAALVPSNGSILVDGQPLLKQEHLLKSHLGYLPQTFGLYDTAAVRSAASAPVSRTRNASCIVKSWQRSVWDWRTA